MNLLKHLTGFPPPFAFIDAHARFTGLVLGTGTRLPAACMRSKPGIDKLQAGGVFPATADVYMLNG